ncbi:type II toxin-antitoxin system RelE/ParE family toxin [Vibrio crassostreae]|uniref:type II toxin-antitoxin system RelE/ParE family toxin n=1 Tax=Vibrio crassostreae TaxID=246167 RepID=UPI000F4638CA|nr:type II toxin-antitoxin system RelE/ParE family toxin [Vibrio crassostreae]NOH77543.1 type II toxin-antitoxin system RelE/ParE family toxin [Vibrio crassostreae]NOI55652.1 type II toxin-antitoxin system RelE/ParE family toxin [Vibrio crassostreae]ROR09692.1 ParE-like toxin of type II ParDE toxin-antitoxin system [Vibrio crassostreae]CAK1793802.1 ParE-like toxin of type II ParDE toxin-antitoxin system [Vibrio crassostreae]CAK2279447.1 ParE-like toxin of type II ParDE toxin-antitoxin system [
MTTIEYTDTFEQLLDALINYLSDYSSEESVIERIEALLDRFEALVSDNPHAANITPSLLELGVKNFREFHLDSFRIIYRTLPTAHPKETRVIVDVIALQKQNLEQLLIQHCILYK